MRIAFIQGFLPSRSQGGVGHFTDQLAAHMVRRGHEVTVFSLDPAPSWATYSVVRPELHARWTRSRLGAMFGFGVWVARQDYEHFDVIHAMGDNHLLRARVPIVRTLHGSALGEAIHSRRVMVKLAYLAMYGLELAGVARASASVGVSATTNRHFPTVARVIPNGVDLDVFVPSTKKSACPSILAVGHRLRDRKRLNVLLTVFQARVRTVLRDAELWLVCDDHVDQPGVRSLSNLSAASLAEMYRQAWVFCLPSSYEGFGRPYLEAMASGTAVLATRNGGASDLLGGPGGGQVIDLPHLGDSLLTLLTDSRRRQELERWGVRTAQGYAWPKVVVMYEELYSELLRQTG